MFVDYYSILETTIDASPEEIRNAYRRMALRWHPDKNPGEDTLSSMQAVNEAHLILGDPEGRVRYDIEYRRYHQFKASHEAEQQRKGSSSTQPQAEEYVFADETLQRWMQNARKQAAEFSRMTQREFMKGAGAAAEEMGKSIVSYLIFSVVLLLIFAASKGCG